MDQLFSTVIINQKIDAKTFLICTAVSLVLGLIVALSYMYKGRYTKSFVITLALLPVIVQSVIMMVNGNLGTGVAVLGAFSLVRFRSVPGTAKEICSIFLAMAIGLATGMGCAGIAALLTIIVVLVEMLYTVLKFGEGDKEEKELRITIPESLDYSGLFDDLFEKYTSKSDLIEVRTTNMGSLYKLRYTILLKDKTQEKAFLDDLRCRNGNLDIACGKVQSTREEL